MINGRSGLAGRGRNVVSQRNWHPSCSSNPVTFKQEAIMDWDDLLALVTLGALAPYLATAAADWVRRPKH